ncbi:hypothetical protein SO802_028949 [Lithocarpus litseifolius]|uniref:Retrotransposon gag domain-containing protein n=1 Tax=Lithocarpus litseifolius TaxID=425828 RepID=A0AAW2BXD2_9ROSI
MVLTRSMATNNNGEEPCTTTLERQVQTLAVAVECLTKQNHDLEEQLHQRDAGPNNHGKEQKCTSAKSRDQEGPEGSNAPSRQERQDTSRPSVVKTAPPHIVTKMRMMKERMDFMMNALRGRVSSDLNELVHRTNSPFTASITLFPLPLKFRMPQVEAYYRGHRYKKSTACLMSIKQREEETLRSYITRFNKEAFSIDEANDKILVAAFTNRLRKGKFLFSLYKKVAKTMSDVLY